MATQNAGYNQPTQPGFYFGADLGRCFPEKERVVRGDRITLDAGMDYDSCTWSIGGSGRLREITTRECPAGQRTRVEVTVSFRGWSFTDFVFVTLKP
jgi:rhamnogalacturonan endolyase